MNFPRRRRRSQELSVPSRQRQSYFEKDKPKIKSVIFFFYFCCLLLLLLFWEWKKRKWKKKRKLVSQPCIAVCCCDLETIAICTFCGSLRAKMYTQAQICSETIQLQYFSLHTRWLWKREGEVSAGGGVTRSWTAKVKHLEPGLVCFEARFSILFFSTLKNAHLCRPRCTQTRRRGAGAAAAAAAAMVVDCCLRQAAEWQAEPGACSWPDRRDMSIHLLPRSPGTLKSVIHVWCVQIRGCRHVLPPPYFFFTRWSRMQEHVHVFFFCHQSVPQQSWWN